MSGAAYFSPAPPPSLHPESRGAHGAQQRTVECSLSVTGDDMHHSDEHYSPRGAKNAGAPIILLHLPLHIHSSFLPLFSPLPHEQLSCALHDDMVFRTAY